MLAGHRLARLRTAILVAGALFLLAQLARPSLPNPPVVAELDAPAEVRAILRTGCYDCHSNETKLRWFDEVVPAYWLVVHHVLEGREHLNFSEIGRLPAAQQKARLYEAINFIALGEMPPGSYLALHGGARVTAEELATLKAYAERVRGAQRPTRFAALSLPVVVGAVAPAPNGIAFPPDYGGWSTISVTDRFDNGTLRVIAGNPVATRAIAEGSVPPWPDGTAFAKIALRPATVGQAGAFLQVEFMFKDARRYARSEGWGWGRWVGQELKPYGADDRFDRECVGCHAPMRHRDNVYSLPLSTGRGSSEVFNTQAALPADAPFHQPLGRLVSLTVDETRRTIDALFASDARQPGGPEGYPGGAGPLLSLVTWEPRDDPHWFGARIPGAVRSVEIVTLADARAGEAAAYDAYSGHPLARSAPPDGANREGRIAAILARTGSASP